MANPAATNATRNTLAFLRCEVLAGASTWLACVSFSSFGPERDGGTDGWS
jgi:hypothetical protein